MISAGRQLNITVWAKNTTGVITGETDIWPVEMETEIKMAVSSVHADCNSNCIRHSGKITFHYYYYYYYTKRYKDNDH